LTRLSSSPGCRRSPPYKPYRVWAEQPAGGESGPQLARGETRTVPGSTPHHPKAQHDGQVRPGSVGWSGSATRSISERSQRRPILPSSPCQCRDDCPPWRRCAAPVADGRGAARATAGDAGRRATVAQHPARRWTTS
jgi:hypothetical protein